MKKIRKRLKYHKTEASQEQQLRTCRSDGECKWVAVGSRRMQIKNPYGGVDNERIFVHKRNRSSASSHD